ncbi:unnamed protein product [Caenorhabditis angaria]|uniref:Major facilitator superfamily (MFS) profile domain-containing protein n=1 Tax=Caenorhabditis angaria TaxID=860376 RepID=A0A9P1J7H5_9PELO|nr:unnamed protein product [Caenorhabditis angaria]
MSRQRENSHNFTQDPLDVSSSPEREYSKTDDEEDEKRDTMTNLERIKPFNEKKKIVSIAPPKPARTESQILLTRPTADSMVSDNENTPLLHPSSSLPTVVGYDELIEDYPGPSNTTRSEIGRNELKKKRRKRSRYNTISSTNRQRKPRPLIMSPFMPISTQISVDAAIKERIAPKSRYGSTTEKLMSKSSSEESASDEDEEESGSEVSHSSSQISSAFKLYRSMSYREIVTLIMLCLANLCSTVAFSCIAPFYPTEANEKNLTETEIGIVFGVFEFTMFIVSPIFGKYIIKIGAKRLFVLGLAITGITAILFGFLNFLPSGELFFWFSFLIRIVEAIGDAAFVTSSFAISAKLFPKNIAMIVGLLETFAGLGYTAGPVIGGLLYDFGGFQVPFLALGIVLLVATGFGFYLIEDTKDEDECDNDGKGMMTMLRIGEIWMPLFGTIACAISLSFLDPTLTPHLEAFNMSNTGIGLMFLLCGGVYTATAPIFGSYVDSYHCGALMMMFGSLATILSMVFIGPSPLFGDLVSKNLVVIGASLALLGVSASALYVPCFQTCLDIVKSRGFEDNFHTYGCVSGIFQAAFGFGSFVGPTFGSFLMELIGFPWTTTVIAGLHFFLLAYFIINTLVVKYRRSSA